MDPTFELRQRLSDDVIEYAAVSRTAEQGLLVIAAQNDVIAGAGDVKARRSGHPCPLLVKAKPLPTWTKRTLPH